jgi:hypothetical protein
MTLVFRTMIVTTEHVTLARQLAETLAGPAGQDMWSVPLSATGAEPATHWESTGWIGSDFAALLPLSEWYQDTDGEWLDNTISEGQPAMIVALAAEAGLTVSLAEVEALLASADITEQEWPVARGRMGLVMVQPTEVVDG